MAPQNTLLRASIFTLLPITMAVGLALLIKTNNRNIESSQNTARAEGEAPLQSTSPIRDFNPFVSEEGQPPLLTEFGDFQCPHCARFAVARMPEIKRDLIDTGMVRFEYRHYPFLGPESFMAAEAAECARDQDQFQQYHGQLYLSIITGQLQSITTESLEETARLLSLDLNRYRSCVAARTHEDRVKQDKAYGRSPGVQRTPSLFINGEKVEWDSYRDLRDRMDRIARHTNYEV